MDPAPLLAGLALARQVLDRADPVRSAPERLTELWSDPSASLFVLSGEHATVLTHDDGSVGLALRSPLDFGAVPPPLAMFLGFDEGRAPIFALDDPTKPQLPDGQTLRQVGSDLSARDAEIFTTAVALTTWHRRHQHCPLCGQGTAMARGGWIRTCAADGSEHFPRTDPAVIMLVRDSDDRALLGRRATWEPGWFSTLAGFVEPGESAEAAVVREVAEEASVVVDGSTVQFLGSQPWPFPSSLMLGFHAYATSQGEPIADGEEMAEVSWFTREEVRAQCESGELKIPPAVSIARHLIERWYGQELPGQWSRP